MIIFDVSLFVVGGHDTTANTLARILHLLTLNPDVQTRLREEVTEAQADGDLTYDKLMTLPYLDAVIRESFRVSVVYLLAIRRPCCLPYSTGTLL